jgi:NACalpha-BTF3-like transcription factor
VEQLEISKAEADIAIRQADGDVSAAMAALVN